MDISRVNSYLAHKQHLLPTRPLTDLVEVTRDIVALHSTGVTGPHLSLWARVPGFQRQMLEDVLYEGRDLVRVHCMRGTLHIVPSDEAALFLQAYVKRRSAAARRDWAKLFAQAGLCEEGEAGERLERLHRQVLDVLTEKGPSTVREINEAMPELQHKIRHDVGKPYEGAFSIGSRLVPGMCTLGLLVRARPRGTWRSSLHEYAALSDWLPAVHLDTVTPQAARAWLVRRYLAAYGPATLEDVQWWTGFTKGETREALKPLEPELREVEMKDLGDGHLMLTEDTRRLADLAVPDAPYVFFLPSLDPYIMGYQGRRRFLAPQHRDKVFDRAGNAMPTVWANGQVVGAWGQRKDGSVVYRLFEPVSEEERALVESKRQQLEGFLGGEFLPRPMHTPFTRALE